MQSFTSLFNLDALSWVMMVLVTTLGTIIGLFASRYMKGDRLYRRFLIRIGLLMLSVTALSSADNIYLFLILWLISNFLLVGLIIHKSTWQASQSAGALTAKTFLCGFICLATALGLLAYQSDTTSIQLILSTSFSLDYLLYSALVLIILAAMTQSAIWPFHRWLLSSLNSPTPASALMHAGLVNGGGLLLVRFAPLYLSHPHFLQAILTIGITSAIMGTFWKLMQNDVKRMLACSTLSQMGFMFIQCGLGLFPAAVAHLCWHGFFKAHLFLSSGSAAQVKRVSCVSAPTMVSFLLALPCGAIGSYIFAVTTHQSWLALDTTLVLLSIVFIAATQIGITLLQTNNKCFVLACIIAGLFGFFYGTGVALIEAMLPSNMLHPQSLTFVHIITIILFSFLWLMGLFSPLLIKHDKLKRIWSWLYVKGLNANQPHPDTITPNRNLYQL